jgi:hypothetical protein
MSRLSEITHLHLNSGTRVKCVCDSEILTWLYLGAKTLLWRDSQTDLYDFTSIEYTHGVCSVVAYLRRCTFSGSA